MRASNSRAASLFRGTGQRSCIGSAAYKADTMVETRLMAFLHTQRRSSARSIRLDLTRVKRVFATPRTRTVHAPFLNELHSLQDVFMRHLEWMQAVRRSTARRSTRSTPM